MEMFAAFCCFALLAYWWWKIRMNPTEKTVIIGVFMIFAGFIGAVAFGVFGVLWAYRSLRRLKKQPGVA